MRERHILPIGMVLISLTTFGMYGCRKTGGKEDKPSPAGFAASELQKSGASGDANASIAPRKSCQSLAPYKIVGGQVVSEKSQVAAATVKLLIRGQKYCTGTLIGPQHLVTAAHCVAEIKDPAEIKIASGVEGKTQEKLQVDGIKVHPQYVGILANDQGYLNQPIYDVAALTFRGTLPSHLVPVSLARPEEIQAGMPVIVSGYGAYGSDDKSRRPLTLVETRLSRVETGLMELQIASGEGRGACFGDSGGPTFVVDSASSCLLLIGSTTGPGRNTDYSCESGGGTLMDLTRYQSWLACAYKNLNQPHQGLVASVNPTVACDSK